MAIDQLSDDFVAAYADWLGVAFGEAYELLKEEPLEDVTGDRLQAAGWDETKHPRDPGGEEGGQFVPKDASPADESEGPSGLGIADLPEKATATTRAAAAAIGKVIAWPGVTNVVLLPDEDSATARRLNTGEIGIHADSSDKTLREAIVHEYGHILDSRVLGHEDEWATQTEALDPFYQAAKKSPTIQAILNDEVEILKGDQQTRAYMTQGREMFARAFSQYVATKSQDEVLLAGLRQLQGDKLIGFQVWQDDEFEPIAAELEKVLKKRSLTAAAWDESKHPRHAPGTEKGGEFAPKDTFVGLQGFERGPGRVTIEGERPRTPVGEIFAQAPATSLEAAVSDWGHLREQRPDMETVDVGQLVPTQDVISAVRVEEYLQELREEGNLPELLDSVRVVEGDDGRLYIADGHNRVAAALRAGHQQLYLPVIRPQLSAAAVAYTGGGGMVCLYPTREQAEAIAREGGQPADDLHVTLLFFEDGVPADAPEAVRGIAFDGLEGEITGVARFKEGEDGVPVVGLVSAVGLNELRADLARALSGFSERYGFVPHLTLGYEKGDGEGVKEAEGAVGRPVTFGAVKVKNKGDEPVDVLTAAGFIETEHPRWPKGHPDGGQFRPKEGGEGIAFLEDVFGVPASQPSGEVMGSLRDPDWAGPSLQPEDAEFRGSTFSAVDNSDRVWDGDTNPAMQYDIDMDAFQEAIGTWSQMDQYKQTLEGNMRAVAQDGELMLTTGDGATLSAIVEDGRFKNQFETGSSGGAFVPDIRAAQEELFFGYPQDTPPEERPVYGWLDHPDNPDQKRRITSQYGTVTWHVKPEVKNRTTLSFVDSLSRPIVPGPIKNPGWRSTVPPGYEDDGMPGYAISDHNLDTGLFDGDAIETQYHGGLALDDIRAADITVFGGWSVREVRQINQPEIEELERRGIPVHFVNVYGEELGEDDRVP